MISFSAKRVFLMLFRFNILLLLVYLLGSDSFVSVFACFLSLILASNGLNYSRFHLPNNQFSVFVLDEIPFAFMCEWWSSLLLLFFQYFLLYSGARSLGVTGPRVLSENGRFQISIS